ncbi:hypothetical protein QF026_006258 [Streptomyces aurantiacus]|nr:hypothetical protein [Streptomyces aurantiacus]
MTRRRRFKGTWLSAGALWLGRFGLIVSAGAWGLVAQFPAPLKTKAGAQPRF